MVKIKAIGLIKIVESDIKEMLKIVKENNFNYNKIIITIEFISFINGNNHITFKLLRNHYDLIDFLINNNENDKLLNVGKGDIYFFDNKLWKEQLKNKNCVIKNISDSVI